MIRVVYFVSVLLCVGSIFCYDRIRDESHNLKFIHRKYRNDIRRQFENINKNDRDPDNTAHIDIANFIQNPDQIENYQVYPESNDFRENTLNDYNNYGSVEGNSPKELSRYDQALSLGGIRNKAHDLNVGDLLTDHSNSKNAKSDENVPKTTFDLTSGHNFDHYPAKKCVLKKMKVPFFFHDTESTKPKQHKKRKFFNFHKFRKGKKNIENVTKSTSVKINHMDTTVEHQKLIKKKRSYFEILCPACRQKFIEKFRPHTHEDMENEIIHNTRQYCKNNIRNEDYEKYLKINGGVAEKNYDKQENY